MHGIRFALKNSPAIKENKEVRDALNKRVVEISQGVAKIEMEQTKAREAGDVKVRAGQYKSVKNLWKESGLPEGTAVEFLTFGPTHMNRPPPNYDFRKKIRSLYKDEGSDLEIRDRMYEDQGLAKQLFERASSELKLYDVVAKEWTGSSGSV